MHNAYHNFLATMYSQPLLYAVHLASGVLVHVQEL